MNNKRPEVFRDDHLSLHLVTDARITTSTISLCRYDAVAGLSIENQHNSKSDQHDFRHVVLSLRIVRKDMKVTNFHVARRKRICITETSIWIAA